MSNFLQPKIRKNYKNEIRHIGFELEFSNIEIETILEILEKDFNLKVKKVNNYLYKLESQYGDFILELDFELLTKQKIEKNAKELSEKIGINIKKEDIDIVEKFIGDISKDIVPYEISTPPLPLDEITIIDEIIQELALHEAKGTKHKLYYAFGLHINVEVISLDVKSLLSYMRAYVILQDYINKDAKIDLARKITPFIDNFEKDYIKHILDENYNPSINEFLNDYLKFNPTRNRSLDLLPILAFIDEKAVRAILPDTKIKPRPAFHYRLSNSMIGSKDWEVSQEWNRWILIEDLANNSSALELLSKEYLSHLDNIINLIKWEEKVQSWLKNH
ncbi:amidoligase family protein [Arcobacter sp. YIC-310]|uniref:amidoligase family protein n=1 Tax=Arcobacter sp. YIC-310 TaxID=3376632 RepID=UPI003C200543